MLETKIDGVPMPIERKRIGEAILWQADWFGREKGAKMLEEFGLSKAHSNALFNVWFGKMGDLIRATDITQEQLDYKVDCAMHDLTQRLYDHRYFLDQQRFHRGVEWDEVVDDILSLQNQNRLEGRKVSRVVPHIEERTADLHIFFPDVEHGGSSMVHYEFKNNDESPVVSSVHVEKLLKDVHNDIEADLAAA